MRIVIWGTGETGLAAAREMLSQGHEIRLADERMPENALDLPVKLLDRQDMDWADLVIPSPGVPRDHEMFSYAKKVLSEIEVASSLINSRIIAVTGTNGKTTTTTLIYRILCAAGFDVGIGGNISPPLISLVRRNPAYIVAEISSFQLEWIEHFKPYISICLNITPDHLDRYRDMDEYIYYKLRIFANQDNDDVAVINNDDPYLKDLAEKSPIMRFSLSDETDTSGISCVMDSRIYFRGDIEGQGPLLPDCSSLGSGVMEDMLAASIVGRRLGVDNRIMEEVFRSFNVIGHRFEKIASIDGIDFIDDSKATNVGAVDKALYGINGGVILILGGKDKGGDFAGMISRYKSKIKKAIVLGNAAKRISREIETIVDTEPAQDMKQAVTRAYTNAASGDTVLLSPGCSSFDMYTSYAHRGDVFKTCVNRLKKS